MSKRGMAIAGIVLSVICLVLIIINVAIGAKQEHHEEARFQKDQKDIIGIHEVQQEHHEEARFRKDQKDIIGIHENEEEYVFTLRDGDGNILMTGGIESAKTVQGSDSTGAILYMVEIQFTDAASETFYQITSEHIGENLGIYLNEEMISSPEVQSAIAGGTCLIANLDSQEDADQLATLLRSTK